MALVALPGPAGAVTGQNLVRNPGAEAGAASAQGWDAVTIPGWSVDSGLPTVVDYGTRGFPKGPDGRLFAGGAGGTARLSQIVALGDYQLVPEPLLVSVDISQIILS